MSRWGNRTYDDDKTMDRIGDVWRLVFDAQSADFVFRTTENCLKENEPNGIGFSLWTFCGIELPADLIKRLACLLTTNPNVARAFCRKIGIAVFEDAILKVTRRSSVEESLLASIVSYFVSELGLPIGPTLKGDAVILLEGRLSKSTNSEERDALTRELSLLQGA
jgi:hypothetical protein